MMITVMVVVVMLRRSRVMVVVMNLPARDSDGRVIHDAASVEVSLQNIPKQWVGSKYVL